LPEAEAFFAASAAAKQELEIAEPVITETPLDDSIAAKLQRIRAVVSSADHASEDDDFSEDQHAENFVGKIAAKPDLTADAADDFDITDFSVETYDEIHVKTDVQADAIADIQAASQADAFADAQDDMDEDEMSAILARLEGAMMLANPWKKRSMTLRTKKTFLRTPLVTEQIPQTMMRPSTTTSKKAPHPRASHV
jgi:hypothetical protein